MGGRAGRGGAGGVEGEHGVPEREDVGIIKGVLGRREGDDAERRKCKQRG